MSNNNHAVPVVVTSRAQRVEAKRATPLMSELERDLEVVRMLATMMDSQFKLGTIRVGIDSVLGLLPVVGDVISAGIGMYVIMLAKKHNLGRWTVAKMLANLAADFAVGVVPIVGDAADVFFKANLRNLKIFEKAVQARRQSEIIG